MATTFATTIVDKMMGGLLWDVTILTHSDYSTAGTITSVEDMITFKSDMVVHGICANLIINNIP